MITNEVMNMLREDVRREQQERHDRIMPIFMGAFENGDIEKACHYVEFVPEIMSDALEIVYPHLSKEDKFFLPLRCYLHNGDRMPVVRKYVRMAKAFMPPEKRIPAKWLDKPTIEVFRAGTETADKAKHQISWTTDIEVAQWFYDRSTKHFGRPCHLYRATICPEEIIWYTNDREEKEVLQYGSVRNVTEIRC